MRMLHVTYTCCGMSLPHKAHPGETVTFTCKYPAEFQKYFKYLYKVTNHNLSVVIYTLGSSVQKGRFSISDHTEKNLFNVSISNLTVEDAGVYLCGGVANYETLFNKIGLLVGGNTSPAPTAPAATPPIAPTASRVPPTAPPAPPPAPTTAPPTALTAPTPTVTTSCKPSFHIYIFFNIFIFV
uniref:Immunoglobulin subtype domain-containing protein n=1 Tax=Astyanax mexicanus TaxID=7994 RepID=A0A8B9HTX6_ASTMX